MLFVSVSGKLAAGSLDCRCFGNDSNSLSRFWLREEHVQRTFGGESDLLFGNPTRQRGQSQLLLRLADASGYLLLRAFEKMAASEPKATLLLGSAFNHPNIQ